MGVIEDAEGCDGGVDVEASREADRYDEGRDVGRSERHGRRPLDAEGEPGGEKQLILSGSAKQPAGPQVAFGVANGVCTVR